MKHAVEFIRPGIVKHEGVLLALGEGSAVEHLSLRFLERSSGHSMLNAVLVEPAHYSSDANFQVLKLEILDL